MNPLTRLIIDIELASVHLSLAGDALSFKAPPDVMTADLLMRIKEHKSQLIELLRRMKWGRDADSDGTPNVERGSDGLIRDLNAPNMRRLVYSQAREIGFTSVDVIEAGEPAWRVFCRDGDLDAVVEMGLALDDVIAAFPEMEIQKQKGRAA